VCVQSVMNRLHVISIPYSLMKVNPLSWIQKVHTYKGECVSVCHGLLTLSYGHLHVDEPNGIVAELM